MKYSPVVIFCFKRLDTLKKLLESLALSPLANSSPIYIYSDSGRNALEQVQVEEVRSYLKSLKCFENLNLIFQEKNLGLANSVIFGVTQVVRKYGKVIVLEDDLKLSSNFLPYMNSALNFYANNSSIGSISGYRPNFVINKDYIFDAFISKRVTSWGWATWEDRWEAVNWNFSEVFASNKLDLSQYGGDLKSLVNKQLAGKIDSWAIRWFYFHLVSGLFSVVPSISKVENIGFGISATHTQRQSSFFDSTLDVSSKIDFLFPKDFDSLNQSLCKTHILHYSYINKLYHRIRTILKNLLKK